MSFGSLTLFRIGRAGIATALLLGSAFPLLAQQLGQGSADSDFSLWRIVVAFVFLLILVAIAWALTKARGRPLQFFKPAAERRIKIVEVARTSAQTSICLVRFDGAEYLLAITPNGATLIEKCGLKDVSPNGAN